MKFSLFNYWLIDLFRHCFPIRNRRSSRRNSRTRQLSVSRNVQLLELRALPSGVTITVLNTNDAGFGSLRDAINQANIDNSGDIINFASSLNGGTIYLTSGPIQIDGSLSIDGPGSGLMKIDGGW